MNNLLTGAVALLRALGSWIIARAIEPSTYAGLAVVVASVDGGKLSALLNQLGPYAPYIAGALGVAGMAASTSGSGTASGAAILADIETVIRAIVSVMPAPAPAIANEFAPPAPASSPPPAILDAVKAMEAVAAPYIPPAGDVLTPPAPLAPEIAHAL